MSKIGKILFALVIALSLVSLVPAQDRGLDVVARSVGGADYKIGRQYAVLIAVDRYKEWTPLRNPVKDARAVRDILQRRYFIDEIVELYDEDATAVGIRRLFADLIDRTKPADSVLIYYAGHGYTDRFQTGFWIPADGGKDIEAQERWLPNQQIRNFVTQIKAHSVALVSDSCFSGDLLNVHRGAAPTVDSVYFRNALKYTSRQVLTSGASETVPDESEFARQFKSLLENNTEQVIDPLVMYDRIRRGVTKTLPLLGTLPGQETGGSFLLFLKEGASQASAGSSSASSSAPASFKPQSSNDAELMVSLSGGVKTADIYVNGAKVGTAPALVQKLPSGVPLVIEVRSGYDSGRTELTLKPKELKEISLKLERMKGNLFIEANEKDVDAYLDGIKLGALGSGLFRDLSAGERTLELKGSNLYYKGSVTIPGNETGRTSAKVYGIGSVEVNAPDGVTVSLSGNGQSRRVSGSATIADLPVGSYTLSSSGSGYESASTNLSIGRGTVARWTPYSVGTLTLSVEPFIAQLVLDGKSIGMTPKSLSLGPGTHTMVFSSPGYHDAVQSVAIQAGRATPVAVTLKEMDRGSIVILEPPFGADLWVDNERTIVRADASSVIPETLTIPGVKTGLSIELSVQVMFADSVDDEVALRTVTLKEGENQTIELPVGSFSLPWLPPDAELRFVPTGSASVTIPLRETGSFLRSPSLAAGTYTVALSGRYPFFTQVRIEAGKTIELPGYREALGGALKAQRLSAERAVKAKANRKTAGWVSLGAGILGAGGAAAAYVLGAQARDAYVSAEATSDATAARDQVALWGSVFAGAASVGGAGLGLAPLLWAIGPDPKALEDSIKALDEGLKRLGE